MTDPRRPGAFAAACLLLAGAPAAAQEVAPDGGRPVLSLIVENDLFGGTDRNYSNGLRLAWTSRANDVHPWLQQIARTQPWLELEGDELRQGAALEHLIFTPDDISLADPPADQRPYAGYLGAHAFAAARGETSERSLSVRLGIVGPSAGGEFVQVNWHQLIDGQEPLGWDAQLHDEIVFAVEGQRLERLAALGDPRGWSGDVIGHAGLSLGTLRTDLSLGATARFGFGLESDFAPPRIRPALAPSAVFRPSQPSGAYVFLGFGRYAVARDVFLDGNTFRDSRSVDRDAFVADAQAGVAAHFGRMRAAFTYVVRSEQFATQNGPDRFGAVSVTFAL